MTTTIKRPKYFLKTSQLRTTWPSVLLNSAFSGPPGITHLSDDDGTHVLEYRDDRGRLRGVVACYADGELLCMTDPIWQRKGVCAALLAEADRLHIPIDYSQQSYTRAGWRATNRHLRRGSTRGLSRVEGQGVSSKRV